MNKYFRYSWKEYVALDNYLNLITPEFYEEANPDFCRNCVFFM